jgi:glyoxylase-like metal-dependent hydrolase (beta-lactamase superfamily II)
MIIDSPGKITDAITLLGRKESCIYLLDDGNEYTILGGGMTYIVPDVMKQLEDFGIDEKKISRIIILHSHFDHVGILPYFRKHFPWITVCASNKARERLHDAKTLDTIISLNTMVLKEFLSDAGQDLVLEAAGFSVDKTLSEGDVLRCGNLHLQIIEVPGHSTCSIAVYVPEEKALFASDAGGIPFNDTVFAAANSNFDHYQQSLEKMARLDVEVHLAEHYGAYTGEDGRSFIERSIISAGQTRQLIEETYCRNRHVAATTQEITDMFIGSSPDYFLPREIMLMVIGQMTRYIAKALDMAPKET